MRRFGRVEESSAKTSYTSAATRGDLHLRTTLKIYGSLANPETADRQTSIISSS